MSNPEIDNYVPEHNYTNIDKYGDYVFNNWFSANSRPEDKDPRRSLFIMSLGLSGEVGEIMEKIKKHVRDGFLDSEALKKEFGDALFYLVRLMREFGFQPSEVIATNIKKLDDRRARGVQSGSGDNR